MATHPDIHGDCPLRFAPVRAAFAENLQRRDEVGAAVAVVVDGELVVDLWAGHADLARSRPWQRDTIVNVYCAPRA